MIPKHTINTKFLGYTRFELFENMWKMQVTQVDATELDLLDLYFSSHLPKHLMHNLKHCDLIKFGNNW